MTAAMTDALPAILLSETEVISRVDALALAIAPHVDDDTVAVCLPLQAAVLCRCCRHSVRPTAQTV